MIPCQVEKLPRLRKYLGTTQEPRELPAPPAAVPAEAGLNSSACSADMSITVTDKSSPSTSISAIRHWSFFFAQAFSTFKNLSLSGHTSLQLGKLLNKSILLSLINSQILAKVILSHVQ